MYSNFQLYYSKRKAISLWVNIAGLLSDQCFNNSNTEDNFKKKNIMDKLGATA